MAGSACSTGSAATASLSEILRARRLDTLFQPIFAFRESRMLGFEALVRGPAGSDFETPFALFGAAQREGSLVQLNIVCIQETLRAYARGRLPGLLFLNISPQLIVQRGFDQARAARFLSGLGLEAAQVVIELTEDYPSCDLAPVRESLRLYRAMGFRVALDDLGEGSSSLRLWSELRPEFVKADKHFVTGIADDAMKVQFMRAIQQIAESSGSRVIAEGIENADDFRLVKGLGIACGQGWFIGRPERSPGAALPAAADAAHRDTRSCVLPGTAERAANDSICSLPDAARHTNPLTLLPGQVPMHLHLERLLERRTPFAACLAEIEELAGLNDEEGFGSGDGLIQATARLLESTCRPGVDFLSHVGGTRFVALIQGDDWRERADRAVRSFPRLLESHTSAETFARGYFRAAGRDGSPTLRPLPRLVMGVCPVPPGVFVSRSEVLAEAKAACQRAARGPVSALHVEERHAHAYPQSLLLDAG